MSQKVIITGVAGFIGYHTCNKFLKEGFNVLGIDNINDYYDKNLKLDRLKNLQNNFNNNSWEFIKSDIENEYLIKEIFEYFNPDIVINLAAQAGVRYSITNPKSYTKSNLIGFANILEVCRNLNVKHLLYGSSSSVYGGNIKTPFKETDPTSYPISFYAATKSANELMAQSYSHLYNIACTGLRFFTVYGPWGRPDMALYIFTKKIISGEPIDVYGHGKMKRDFTFIDDIVEGVIRLIDKPSNGNKNWSGKKPSPSSSSAPWAIFNIGNNKPTKLEYFISLIEKNLGKKAIKNYLEMQPGDVSETAADIDNLDRIIGFKPSTSIEDGIPKFISWYKNYH